MDIGNVASCAIYGIVGVFCMAFGGVELFMFFRPQWRAQCASALLPKPSLALGVSVIVIGFAMLCAAVWVVIARP